MFLDDKDKEDDNVTVIELYVGLKCQYKNTKITHQSNFTVGTQVSEGHWYIQESGRTLQTARQSSAGSRLNICIDVFPG